MTLKLEFSPEEVESLRKKAEEKGVPLEVVVKNALFGAQETRTRRLDPKSDDPYERDMANLQHLLPRGLRAIPDEALRRENLYADEGEQRSE